MYTDNFLSQMISSETFLDKTGCTSEELSLMSLYFKIHESLTRTVTLSSNKCIKLPGFYLENLVLGGS